METKREDIEQRGHRKRLRLGDMLVKEDVITQDQLNEALKEQKRTNERLGQILMRLEFVNEETILKFLSSQLSIPYATSLADIDEIPKEVAEIIPEFFIRRRKLFPISMEEDSLLVAMADPLDIFALDDVKVLIGDMKLKPIISSEREINALIEKHYGKSMAMEELMKDMEADELQVKEEKEEDIDLSKLTTDSKSAPVVRLVNHILLEAIKQGASDIHIEPYEKHVRTRYRVDGVLHDAGHHPKSAQAAIISRIKIISRLDISERRLPQDGRARVKVGGRDVDLRVSVTPTNFGEKVVIRILDPASLCLDLKLLGFEPETLEIYEQLIKSPWGLVLITGPTGSGKTTTLYSTLTTINSDDKNIMTVEDPVEYVLAGINQQHVNPDIGLSFAAGLRSFLRQDPDIVLVGEIRDKETAEVAINAALTGHLVFSTLHTNDAPGSVTRLVNMGVEPFLITSTVIMVVAQRLIRLLCPKCKEPYEAAPEELSKAGIKTEEKVTIYKEKGCKYCHKIGYKGRGGIYEIMTMDDELKDMVVKGEPASAIKRKAVEKGMVTLHEAAAKKVLEGKTTIEEILRVTM